MTRLRRSGILIVEAVIASFLMVFAFAAAATLFDGALRWESQGTNLRRAALLAERKMEQIRADCGNIPNGSDFPTHADSVIAGPHPDYADAPGFAFTVATLPNVHRMIPANNLTPTDGMHSPCSLFYTELPTVFVNDALGFPLGDFQKMKAYETFPYSRPMNDTYRMVEVNVTYGGARTFRLVSLIGDPILPPQPVAPNLNATVTVVRVSGPQNLSAGSPDAEYEIRVRTDPAGSNVNVLDCSAVWNTTPDSTGNVTIFALDSKGTRVRVSRGPFALTPSEVRLAAKVRYGGVEAVGISADIDLL